MSDWPGGGGALQGPTLHTLGAESPIGAILVGASGSLLAGVWTTANTAVYIPVPVRTQCTPTK